MSKLWGSLQRRCAPTGNNNHPQCRGRPMCLPKKETQANGRTRRCAHTGNNNHPQCRGRPMCLPEYASKRKKYSSTASGPTGSPSVMIEGRCGTIASFATTKHLCFTMLRLSERNANTCNCTTSESNIAYRQRSAETQ